MNYTEDLDYELWDEEREEGFQAAEPAERLFAQGRAWDGGDPGRGRGWR